jgi:hypothetical protein
MDYANLCAVIKIKYFFAYFSKHLFLMQREKRLAGAKAAPS